MEYSKEETEDWFRGGELPDKNTGSLSKRTDAKILIIIFKLLDESLIVFFVLSREENYIIL